jgi:glycosyltransferase involved in cell wall biosynthesis
VLTSLASGRGPLPEAAAVIRTRDLIVSGVNWRRAHFESARGDNPAGYAAKPSRLASAVVPDLSLITWFPFALAAALRITRSRRFDCVITTSPPESAHLVGLALRRLRGISWIADLQDGWTFEATRPAWPLAAQRKLDRALEATVARNADLVSAVTDPLAADLRERLGARAETFTNGFDPDERSEVSKEQAGLDPDRFSLVYTGRLAFSRLDAGPLLQAVAVLRERQPEVADRLELVFAGPLTDGERAAIEAADAHASVRALGNLDRTGALGLQGAADALLVLVPPDRPRSVATAKLYEYLAAGRPILVLGEESAAAQTVQGTGAGMATSARDPEEIARAIAGLVEGAAERDGDDRAAVEAFGYPAIAARLAERIEAMAAS